MSSVLVTGATGFVGAAVARKLVERGGRVKVLVRPTSDRSNLEGLDVEPVVGDLTDPGSLAIAVRGCEHVYHVAADYRMWVPDPAVMDRTNVGGSRNMIEAAMAADVSRIVHTSSVAALATSKTGEIADETTPVTPEMTVGPYKQSKFRSEAEVLRLVAERNAPVVVVNPSAPVGPGDIRPTPTGRMVLEAARGNMPAYVDTGFNVVHVDDVAEGHLQAMEIGRVGERYILGGDNLPFRDFLNLIAEAAGVAPPRFRVSPALAYPVAVLSELWARIKPGFEPLATVNGIKMARKKMYFSSAKAEAELGYHHRPAAEAIRDAVRWFRETGRLEGSR